MKYITSFVYSLTDFVSEISYTQQEKVYALAQHLVYEAFFGYLIGTMATIVMAGRVAEQMKDEKINAVRDVMRMSKVPVQVRRVIRDYYDMMYKHKTVRAPTTLITSDGDAMHSPSIKWP